MKLIYKYFFCLLIFILNNYNQSQSTELSPNAYASLLTCSSGDELYSAFGHTAIRINDSINGIDIVYNYGTFDFNTPNFYVKFIKGTLLYLLDDELFYSFKNSYEYENRSVREQILDFTREQLLFLYASLQENLKPENRSYRYDIFYDNCSTRVRDMIEKTLNSDALYYENSDKQTFRKLIHPFLENRQWVRFGIDLLLGKPVDKITSAREKCFLPQYLYESVKLMKNPATGKSLVLTDKEIVSRYIISTPHKKTLTPDITFWGLFIIVLITGIIFYFKNRYYFLFNKIFFSIIGLYGFIVIFMMLWSQHASTNSNLNILWSFPFIIPVYWFTSKKIIHKWEKIYNMILFAITGIFLISYHFLPQSFNPAVLPLVLTLLIIIAQKLLFIYKID